MAEIGLIEEFEALHSPKPHKHTFKVEVVVEGDIDEETEFVAGLDHYKVLGDVKKIISTLENKSMGDVLSEHGFKRSVNESVARYFVKFLKDKYPVKFVRIWEEEKMYATVYREDV